MEETNSGAEQIIHAAASSSGDAASRSGTTVGPGAVIHLAAISERRRPSDFGRGVGKRLVAAREIAATAPRPPPGTGTGSAPPPPPPRTEALSSTALRRQGQGQGHKEMRAPPPPGVPLRRRGGCGGRERLRQRWAARE